MNHRTLIVGRSEGHVRTHNQDRLYPSNEQLPLISSLPICVAIADGMGGTENGHLAAEWAIQELQNQPMSSISKQCIEERFQNINDNIIKRAGQAGITGTTLTTLWLSEERFWIGHIGDSRAYIFRQNRLHPLTKDDNLFQQCLQEGCIPFQIDTLSWTAEDLAFIKRQKLEHMDFLYRSNQEELPEDITGYLEKKLQGQFATLYQLAKIFPVGQSKQQLARALGKKNTLSKPIVRSSPKEITSIPIPGDLFLLCSDGLSGFLSDQQLENRLLQIFQRIPQDHPEPSILQWGCDLLLQDATEANSKDNITLLLVQIFPPKEEILPLLSSDKNQPITLPSVESTTLPTSPLITPTPYHLYLAIASLVLLLLLFALWNQKATTPQAKRVVLPRANLSQTNSSSFLLPIRFRALSQRPEAKTRIQAVEKLHQMWVLFQEYWSFTKRQKEQIEDALFASILLPRSIHKLLKKAPAEAGDFANFDQALGRAAGTLFGATAPNYLKYLDELNATIQIPPSSYPQIFLRNRRTQLFHSWLQRVKPFSLQHWKLLLLQERLSKKGSLHSISLLKKSYQILKRENPQHLILQAIDNRIQLHKETLKRKHNEK